MKIRKKVDHTVLYDSIDKTIGGTPLIELKNIEKEFGLKARLFG
ncbi:MAG: hypothetical protein PUK31_05515 [Candidatus Methanomethylophilaceae archaeon]|nr:hypothetical protein [Candidatus Methanomethylophilaceae archaeon]